MRLYIPELEIQLQKVGCDFLQFGDEYDVPCMIADFLFIKYPSKRIVIHTITVTLNRGADSFPLDRSFKTRSLDKTLILASKKSITYSAIIQMDCLPFEGFAVGEKLVFTLDYSVDDGNVQKNKRITYLCTEAGWESYENTCNRIKNPHFNDSSLLVNDEDEYKVTLTGIAYDYEKTYYYFSVSNYSDGPVRLFSWIYSISVNRNNTVNTYDNEDDIPIVNVGPHETNVGVLEIGNRPISDIGFDLMTELDENPLACKATASIRLSLKTEEDKDTDEGILSKWIIGELGITPANATLNDEWFKYDEPTKVNEQRVLTNEDFIVYSGDLSCLYNHDTETIKAVVKIITPSGEITEETVTAAYCRECDIYIMLDYDYKQLCKLGTLRCQQRSVDKYMKWGKRISNEKGWSEQSALRLLGYTVNAKDNLSDAQRHRILLEAVDSGKLTVEEIQEKLIFFIEYPKRNVENALKKWKRDYDFISRYGTDTIRTVGVASIMRTVYHTQSE